MADVLSIRNPRTGQNDYEIAVAGKADIETIAAELRANQVGWRELGVEGRIDVLRRWKDALAAGAEPIVAALSTDTGRHTIARGELGGLIGSIDRWCAIAPGIAAESERPSQAMPQVTMREALSPYPLLGAISPWNFPLLLSFIDAVPALLAGTAVIMGRKAGICGTLAICADTVPAASSSVSCTAARVTFSVRRACRSGLPDAPCIPFSNRKSGTLCRLGGRTGITRNN